MAISFELPLLLFGMEVKVVDAGLDKDEDEREDEVNVVVVGEFSCFSSSFSASFSCCCACCCGVDVEGLVRLELTADDNGRSDMKLVFIDELLPSLPLLPSSSLSQHKSLPSPSCKLLSEIVLVFADAVLVITQLVLRLEPWPESVRLMPR